ncbi:M15 family metallopeptidase [Isoptericola sp. b441]|uniref:M15 family metallopeptidase n=1 Tax=Actinotalea lenta TaxID=3064654 RepID=A0ABT9DDS6_9CELL|nr:MULTISPECIES: M15 family metallopeptidase [unclassified Isoptericola]MDO8108579.1 M15 family metallopeptidase [Isoptericola sp. b441]MDO8119989.1 M15 family metallopeptidase [Isoptericola sp. b490]
MPLSDLRYLRVPYRDPAGVTRTGELAVHADVARDITDVFVELWELGYPITSMRLVDDFGGDDDASMAADNTSGFNCRIVTGGWTWSEHAYGLALDLNPVENPYVRDGRVAPPAALAYMDRPDVPGVLHANDPVVAAFAAIGWTWGGSWRGSVVDYQHFSLRGR